jgi:hypothetical protein
MRQRCEAISQRFIEPLPLNLAVQGDTLQVSFKFVSCVKLLPCEPEQLSVMRHDRYF